MHIYIFKKNVILLLHFWILHFILVQLSNVAVLRCLIFNEICQLCNIIFQMCNLGTITLREINCFVNNTWSASINNVSKSLLCYRVFTILSKIVKYSNIKNSFFKWNTLYTSAHSYIHFSRLKNEFPIPISRNF